MTKRYVVGSGVPSSPGADNKTTGGEAEPNPCMVHMRNVVSRTYPWMQERTPQGGLMVWSAKDEGKSEGPSVIDGIEGVTSPHAKAGRLPSGLSAREHLINRPKEVRQMTTETTEVKASDPSVGATTDMPLDWHQINWRRAERNVRRLQIRIAVRP